MLIVYYVRTDYRKDYDFISSRLGDGFAINPLYCCYLKILELLFII